MKAIVDGLRYDTERADEIGRIGGQAVASDVEHHGPSVWSEALYMTPAGRFFLCGYGAEGTRWFRHAAPENRKTENGQDVGWAIRALEEEQAQAWVEKYCSVEVYEQLWDVEDA